MRIKIFPRLTIASLFVCAACSVLAQTVPAATEGNLPLAVGAGFSAYSPDYNTGHLFGGTLWMDYFPSQVPHFLQGIGIEAEARDLSFGRSSTLPANMRQDTIEGGVIYSWRHFRNIRPYGKFLMGYGNTDYQSSTTDLRGHQSRTVTIAGGGVDIKAYKHIWARVDYEYQSWPDFFKHPAPIPGDAMHPQGFTVGALYRFGGRHFR
jgi:opacity protein-like surface antigen